MKKALWSVGLSILTSFYTGAMDKSQDKPLSYRVILEENPFKKEPVAVFEEEYTRARIEHNLQELKMRSEMEKFANVEKKALQPPRLQPKREPVHDALEFEKLKKTGNYHKIANFLIGDQTLDHYPPAQEMMWVIEQIERVRDGQEVEGFTVPHSVGRHLWPKIRQEAEKAAREGNNLPFLLKLSSLG